MGTFSFANTEFIYGKPDFGMIVVISNREVGVAMSDLNQTVEFIKEIEKLEVSNKV